MLEGVRHEVGLPTGLHTKSVCRVYDEEEGAQTYALING